MLSILSNSWALLFGMFLLMLGNGMQGTLLGLRGAIEGFSVDEMAYVMSAYFLGFLGGSRLTPLLIRRVGHVRVFAAMASIISAVFVLYALAPSVLGWALMRLVVGFCFSAVYVVAESWLNDSATNETRGQLLSIYMIVQMVGIVAAQFAINLGDPAGYELFIVISVAVSLSFAPILLSVSPAPVFKASKPMSFRRLYESSPLGCVGTFFLGAVFSAMFGMSAVYGAEAGLTTRQISIFVAAIYVGGLVFQYPVGWLSDRVDRRLLIIGVTAVAALSAAGAMASGGRFEAQVAAAFMIGGMANPLYSLLIAYTNDFLDPEDMASAAGGLIFINGVGAVSGPVLIGYAMSAFGTLAYFGFMGAVMGAITLYALYRMTQRPSVPVDETIAYAPVAPTASAVVVELAQEYAVEQSEAHDAEQAEAEKAEERRIP
ncbi:MFS transporter [Oceanicella actignis]|uniref:MFS transporter n=1 Tax=Oceanicella actignis TaxID=1189325 RepID=UPI0011E86320|nr:MFS transporter [Oceanicella actignis]TYO85025.1 putative MFS family arabinose efflux permease [Oceanicella actignis]